VAVHRASIMNTFGVHKTAELVMYALQNGLVNSAVNRPRLPGAVGGSVRRGGIATVRPAARRARRSRFTDVTSAAGLRFTHNSGAYGGKLLPETLGAGCAFLDYDNDGWQDILLDQRHGLARATRSSGRP
jgi:hypothetical protein